MNNEYAQEAKERWGDTEAYRQSQERTKDWTSEDYACFKEDADALMQSIVEHMPYGPTTEPVQTLIAEHYNSLRIFYEPSFEMYRGLAEMYITDPRFTAYYEKYAVGLAQFMHDAMIHYVNMQEASK